MKKEKRPNWHKYFLEMSFLVSQRSTCLRRKVGAVLVKNNQIISTGYNGAPKGVPHCAEVGCLRERLQVPSGERHELCRGVHAEQNAIIQAAVNGTSIKDSVLFCTHHPCSICAKIIINSEIRQIIIANDYPDKLAKEMLKDADLEIFLYNIDKDELKRV